MKKRKEDKKMKTKKGLSLPVTIILAIIVLVMLAFIIATTMGVFKDKKKDTTIVLKTIDEQIDFSKDNEYRDYEGRTTSGTSLREFILNDNVKDDEIAVKVKTLSDKTGTDYLYTLTGSNGAYTLGTAVTTALSDDKKADSYINPDGHFSCEVIYDTNKNVIGLIFTQK